MSLPPEIRDMIYLYLVQDPMREIDEGEVNRYWVSAYFMCPPIFMTCSEIYAEAQAVMFKNIPYSSEAHAGSRRHSHWQSFCLANFRNLSLDV